MLILFIFAFISGLVTIFAPCIWPLLPIILSSTTTGGHKKPLGITLGICLSFALFTLTISYIVKIIPFDPDVLRLFAVIVIGFLGLTLVIPKLTLLLEGFVSSLSSKFAPTSAGPNEQNTGFWSGFLTGFSLGLVWSPCAGPILATIATLAATQAVNFQIILVTLVYVTGIGIPLFIFATLGSNIFQKSRSLSPYTARIQQVFGVIMILTAVSIATGYDKVLQAKLLDAIPAYSNFLYKLESNPNVKQQLDELKKGKQSLPVSQPLSLTNLPNLGIAPEFVGIAKWLNSEPLNLAQMRGKVVLIDFWTYTCINCIRTLPHVTTWYEKYKDKGLVIIGVHTPEFEFEKKTDNVQAAIKQYNIKYPVAQDNDYLTWRAYSNQYWPAKYLIDNKGNIRYTHFGEGDYDKTEQAIQDLLKEAGLDSDMPLEKLPDTTPTSRLTPETYLGFSRMQRFTSPEKAQLGVHEYTLPKEMALHSWALEGTWDLREEYVTSSKNSSLEFNFSAGKVFLVIHPATSSDIIQADIDGGTSKKITVTEPKLYTIADFKGQKGNHLLHMDFLTPGTKIYAFTFGE